MAGPQTSPRRLVSRVSPGAPVLRRQTLLNLNHRLGLWRAWVPVVWARDRARYAFSPRLGVLHNYPPRPTVITRHKAAPARWKPKGPLPTVSIVTPSYNQAHFIRDTIDSVLGQDYPLLDYWVQDGNSSDDTATVLAELLDGRREAGWESVPDDGFADAINRGFARSEGEIMAWLNSDDLLLPGTVDYVARFFAAHPEVDVVYGHRVIVDGDGDEIGLWVMPPHDEHVLSYADYVPQETMFWRRSIWEAAGGGIDESLDFAIDWDLILRFRAAGATFRRLPRFMGCFRVHETQKTSAEILERGEAEMMKLRERELGRSVDYPEINAEIRPYLKRHVLHHGAWKLGIFRY